ncbi:MAG: HlyD family efflux transporter periplasmic adaptor subunit [Pigmentiphaga sp.]
MKAVLLGASLSQGRLHDEAFDEVRATRSYRVVTLLFLLLVVFGVWAWFFEIDEVSTGGGKVVPTSREQVIQSLEGGIVTALYVRSGDIVEKDQVLAQLDTTMTEANLEETAARYRAALASASRLRAEIDGAARIHFPPELKKYPALVSAEESLFRSRRQALQSSLRGLNQTLQLTIKELDITQSLLKSGAASNVELIRLQRQRAELELKIAELQSEYTVQSKEEFARANAEVQALSGAIKGRADSLRRLTLRSPLKGIVKGIDVTTIGGVIPPNGQLMQIVPLDEQLLIEARISPRDIAFIHPEQDALVKITAYDYSIYGGLAGKVEQISPDTIRDEVKPEVFYYQVFIRTEENALTGKDGRRHPIVPGMVATVDIKAGSRTIWDYLVKPIGGVKEALRER